MHPLTKTGHFGPFVAHRRTYASLPAGMAPEGLSLERALELLAERRAARPRRRR